MSVAKTKGQRLESFRADWAISLPIIKDAAILCNAVYDPCLMVDICDHRMWEFRYIQPTDTACACLIKTPSNQAVVFRGTVTTPYKFRLSARDWAKNLNFRREDGRHVGFWSEVQEISEELFDLIDPDVPINFYGHSQGGGEAVQAADHADELGYKVGRVITFGAARSIGGDRADRYQCRIGSRTRRIVSGSDPVTWLLPMMYDHVGTLTYLDRRMTTGEDYANVWPSVRLWDQARTWGQLNHTMDASGGYLKKLGLMT